MQYKVLLVNENVIYLQYVSFVSFWTTSELSLLFFLPILMDLKYVSIKLQKSIPNMIDMDIKKSIKHTNCWLN